MFFPIRECVGKCNTKLEFISNSITKELENTTKISEKNLYSDATLIEETIYKKNEGINDLLSYAEEKLTSYKSDLAQAKVILYKIGALIVNQKLHTELVEDFASITNKVSKINDQISKVERNIQELSYSITKDKSIFLNGVASNDKNGVLHYDEELITLLTKIKSHINTQLELIKASLENIDQLSIYLQYEDIISQKLEHVLLILDKIIGGLSGDFQEDTAGESPYFNLVPDLSVLLTNLICLIREEYHEIFQQVNSNVEYVRDKFDKISESGNVTEEIVRTNIEVVNGVLHVLQEYMGSFSARNKEGKWDNPYFEQYFSQLLDSTCYILNDLLDISAEDKEDFLATIDDRYSEMLEETKGIMTGIYDSISDIISRKEQIDDQAIVKGSELESALSRFYGMLSQIVSNHDNYKKILFHNSTLFGSLSKEIASRIENIKNITQIDRDVEKCIAALKQFADTWQPTEFSESESKIYKEIEQIYSMDSERKVHSLSGSAAGDSYQNSSELGSIELF